LGAGDIGRPPSSIPRTAFYDIKSLERVRQPRTQWSRLDESYDDAIRAFSRSRRPQLVAVAGGLVGSEPEQAFSFGRTQPRQVVAVMGDGLRRSDVVTVTAPLQTREGRRTRTAGRD
jgi:hypothetical protein